MKKSPHIENNVHIPILRLYPNSYFLISTYEPPRRNNRSRTPQASH